MPLYDYGQLEGIWDEGGGDPSLAPTMAAISLAESGGNSSIIQQGQPYGTTGWGLWQITPGDSEPKYGTDFGVLDPIANAKAAVAKYSSQGLGAWTTYTGGAYRQFYETGVAPQTVTDPGIPSQSTGSPPAGSGPPGAGGTPGAGNPVGGSGSGSTGSTSGGSSATLTGFDWGDLVNPVGIPEAIFGIFSSKLSAIDKISSMVGLLFTAEPWVRLLEIVAGLGFAAGGLQLLVLTLGEKAIVGTVNKVPASQLIPGPVGAVARVAGVKGQAGRAKAAARQQAAAQRTQQANAKQAQRDAERQKDASDRAEWSKVFAGADARGQENAASAPKANVGGRSRPVVGRAMPADLGFMD